MIPNFKLHSFLGQLFPIPTLPGPLITDSLPWDFWQSFLYLVLQIHSLFYFQSCCPNEGLFLCTWIIALINYQTSWICGHSFLHHDTPWQIHFLDVQFWYSTLLLTPFCGATFLIKEPQFSRWTLQIQSLSTFPPHPRLPTLQLNCTTALLQTHPMLPISVSSANEAPSIWNILLKYVICQIRSRPIQNAIHFIKLFLTSPTTDMFTFLFSLSADEYL